MTTIDYLILLAMFIIGGFGLVTLTLFLIVEVSWRLKARELRKLAELERKERLKL